MDSARQSIDTSFSIVQLDGALNKKEMVYAPKKGETWASKLDIDADAGTGNRQWTQGFCLPGFGQCECRRYKS